MNSLYNLALRQSSSIQSDLTLIESTPVESSSFTSLSGQLTASLAGLGRTVDDYESMAKRELNTQKREKAMQRVKKFREEEREMRASFANMKNRVGVHTTFAGDVHTPSLQSSTSASINGVGPAGTSTGLASTSATGLTSNPSSDSPYSLHARTQTQNPRMAHGALPPQDRPDPLSAYRMNASAAAMFGGQDGPMTAREGYALREHSFIEQTETQLDNFIAQGREVWSNLTEQRDILKGTQRRLRDVGVTLGLSRDVIVSTVVNF